MCKNHPSPICPYHLFKRNEIICLHKDLCVTILAVSSVKPKTAESLDIHQLVSEAGSCVYFYTIEYHSIMDEDTH